MISPTRQRINGLLREAKQKYIIAAMCCASTDLSVDDDPHALDRSFELQRQARELTQEAFRLMQQDDMYQNEFGVPRSFCIPKHLKRNAK